MKKYLCGTVFKGEKVSGLRTGKGFLMLPSGDTYDGSFLEGKWSGVGKYHSQNEGSTFEGNWLEDERQGYGEQKF